MNKSLSISIRVSEVELQKFKQAALGGLRIL